MKVKKDNERRFLRRQLYRKSLAQLTTAAVVNLNIFLLRRLLFADDVQLRSHYCFLPYSLSKPQTPNSADRYALAFRTRCTLFLLCMAIAGQIDTELLATISQPHAPMDDHDHNDHDLNAPFDDAQGSNLRLQRPHFDDHGPQRGSVRGENNLLPPAFAQRRFATGPVPEAAPGQDRLGRRGHDGHRGRARRNLSLAGQSIRALQKRRGLVYVRGHHYHAQRAPHSRSLLH